MGGMAAVAERGGIAISPWREATLASLSAVGECGAGEGESEGENEVLSPSARGRPIQAGSPWEGPSAYWPRPV